MKRLLDKRTLITGGTTGIGLEMARPFLSEGARVAVTGLNPQTLASVRAARGPGWQADAAQSLRFLIDFSCGTGLRAGELAHATLGSIEVDAHGGQGRATGAGSWGSGPAPGSARSPSHTGQWNPATALLGSLDGRRSTVDVQASTKPALAETLRHACLSTTSMDWRSDELRRAEQIGGAFEVEGMAGRYW